MRHIIKHGAEDPTIDDLENYQLGISDNNHNLFVRVNDELVKLNDYKEEPLEQEEIKTLTFTGAERVGVTTSDLVTFIDDLQMRIYRSGYNVSKIEIPYTEEDISVINVSGTSTNEDNKVTLFAPLAVNEYIINISNSFAIRISINKSVAKEYCLVCIESLVFSSTRELVL